MTLSLAPAKPFFVKPEALQHPTIPGSLFGVNPRTIKGQEWWDVVRKAAYAENNHCCWACGKHTSQLSGPLEAHEEYGYDFKAKLLTYRKAVALCKRCHQFIHKGRLYNFVKKKRISVKEAEATFRHGIQVLEEASLLLPWTLYPIARLWRSVRGARLSLPSGLLRYQPPPIYAETLTLGGWKLILDDEEYTKRSIS